MSGPWLRPSRAALLALTADPPDPAAVSADPAAVLHVLRFAARSPSPARFTFSTHLLSDSRLCAAAAAGLTHTAAAPDWTTADPGRRLIRLGRAVADLAAGLAADFTLCSPDAGRAAGLLAPLGWYAVAAADPDAAADGLDDPAFRTDPRGAMTRHWGLDAAAVARRVADAWGLPTPYTATAGFLPLPLEDAVRLGADAGQFRAVRSAVRAVERAVGVPGWVTGTPPVEPDSELDHAAARLADRLGLSSADLFTPSPATGPPEAADTDLLIRLLRATAQLRARSAAPRAAEQHRRVDVLTAAVADLSADAAGRFDTAVRDAKLAALAEFAAGASHEFNNPLAVISGNAQLLRAGETDPTRLKRLDAVVRATKRVHDLLHGTLQFARPSRPTPRRLDLAVWLPADVATHAAEADDRGLTLSVAPPPVAEAVVFADPAQLRQAVGQLVRNALDAAPAGGWVRVGLEPTRGGFAVAVEDSGPGPAAEAVPHLFDPFFSGRPAGRGRGLGLSVAWRLARANGGAVAFDRRPGGPTRFVLTLPAAVEPSAGRKSA